jgi:uncharacterized membrane protein
MLATLRKYFISGLLVWMPIWVTLLVIKFIVDMLSKSLLLLPQDYQPDYLLGFHVPGIGVIVTVIIILVTGLLAANFIGSRVVAFGDALMARIPLVRSVYTGVKQVTQTLFTPGGQSFRKVLLVEYPREGTWCLAFQTGEGNQEIEGKLNSQESMVSYFIPTTPNPTSGFLMMAPKSKVIELDMSVDQALKYVISLGVVQSFKR